MDIISLPDEMLTNVLKYTEFNTVRRIRKLNERMDKLAKRAHIGTRVPVNVLCCCNPFVQLEFPSELGLGKNVYNCLRMKKNINYETDSSGSDEKNDQQAKLKVLANALSKINVLGVMYFGNWPFDDEMIAVLDQNRKSLRCTKSIELFPHYYEVSRNAMKHVLQTIFPKVENLLINSFGKCNLENFCNVEVLGCRQWKIMNFTWKPTDEVQLDESFLLEVAPNCEYFKMNVNNSVTVTGALKLLQKCQKESKSDHAYHLKKLELGETQEYRTSELFADRHECK